MYSTQVNHLLRKYLKKGKLNEFERLVSYANLWGVADDRTLILQAIETMRIHEQAAKEPSHLFVFPLYNNARLCRYLDQMEDPEGRKIAILNHIK